jgi:hypothetical protein
MDTTAAVIRQVRATAQLESMARRRKLLDGILALEDDDRRREGFTTSLLSPRRLYLSVGLAADISDGRRIATSGRDFSLSTEMVEVETIRHGDHVRPIGSPSPDTSTSGLDPTCRVRLKEILDAMDTMLGRNPDMHRPPRLAWGNLIIALDKNGVQATEPMVIAAPFVVDLRPELRAVLTDA